MIIVWTPVVRWTTVGLAGMLTTAFESCVSLTEAISASIRAVKSVELLVVVGGGLGFPASEPVQADATRVMTSPTMSGPARLDVTGHAGVTTRAACGQPPFQRARRTFAEACGEVGGRVHAT